MKTINITEIKQIDNAIVCTLRIGDNNEVITTSFSYNVIKYITADRIDSVVMGLMLFAIKQGYDFKSSIPISESLYYNLTNHFINAITAHSHLHQPQIDAPIITDISNPGSIVATGISCGVDSLYTIYSHTQHVSTNYKINHLVFLNVGSHNTGKSDEDTQKLFIGRRELCRRFAHEIKMPLIEIESTITSIFDKYDTAYSHIEEHTYMALSCLLLLQRGLKIYYYSSGICYSDFNCNFTPHTNFDAAQYDLLTLLCASTYSTKFISAGGNISRMDKIKTICDFDLAHKYLNVCVREANNCGVCFKCIRTLLEIDAIGKLNLFKDSFDINKYSSNRKYYLEQLYIGYLRKNAFLTEVIPYFQKDLTFSFKIQTILKKLFQTAFRKIRLK